MAEFETIRAKLLDVCINPNRWDLATSGVPQTEPWSPCDEDSVKLSACIDQIMEMRPEKASGC